MMAKADLVPLTKEDILAAHVEYGRLNYRLVRMAMGPNWPPEWDALGPGDGIFEPEAEPQ